MQGSIFSAVLAELLDAVSWGQQRPARDSPADSPGSSPRKGIPIGETGSPAASRAASGPLPKVAVQRSNLATASLAAHPFRPLYLSGETKTSSLTQPNRSQSGCSLHTTAAHVHRVVCLFVGSSTGEVFLWRFGQPAALAGYTPMAAAGAAPSRVAADSLFSTPSRSWQLAPGVASAQWGQPQAVRHCAACQA